MRWIKIDLPKKWILPIAFFFLIALLIILEIPMLRFSNGLLIYPRDDGYIRMAIARNLADAGVWGLSPHEFSNASSSIFYPILLAACFKLLGPQPIIPFLVNLAAAVGFIITLQRWLKEQGLPPFHQLLILLISIYLTPLHIMVVYGMEHTLQIWVSLLFIFSLSEWMSQEKNVDGKYPASPWSLYFYGLLITVIRYEGIFLIGVACLVLLVRRKWMAAALLLIAAFFPLTIFGIYSIAHDGYFIPNSILVKAIPLPLNGETIGNFLKEEIVNKTLYPYLTMGNVAANRLLILLPLVYWHYFSSLRTNKLYRYILFFTLAITFLHLVFANANLYYRYEAYLVACGLVMPAVLLAKEGIPLFSVKNTLTRCIAAWTIIFLLYPFFSRSWAAYQEAGDGFLHEYQYNYQAARFLHTYYGDATVVMDESGIASFLSKGKKLDVITGIAYTDITRVRVEGSIPLGYLDYLVKKQKPLIALIVDKKYHPLLRQGWTKVAAWYTSAKLPLGESELDIYAVDPTVVASLRANLKQFQTTMPGGISVDYF
jgi:hypothetical protein